MDDKPTGDSQQLTPAEEGTRELARKSTLAFEVPFTFVGTVLLGGVIGYYLDKWLHSGPWLMVVFGCFGFVAGIVEVARRFGPSSSKPK
jgi:F0F1-type ATP synthase assembly protein I